MNWFTHRIANRIDIRKSRIKGLTVIWNSWLKLPNSSLIKISISWFNSINIILFYLLDHCYRALCSLHYESQLADYSYEYYNQFWIIEEYCFHSGTQIDWNELGLFMFYYCSLKPNLYETIKYNRVHSLDSLHSIVTNL